MLPISQDPTQGKDLGQRKAEFFLAVRPIRAVRNEAELKAADVFNSKILQASEEYKFDMAKILAGYEASVFELLGKFTK